MKKHKIISILLTTVIATSLTACGSGSSDNSNTSVTLNLDMSVPCPRYLQFNLLCPDSSVGRAGD